ncbi:MAG: prepilin-type N-terminal cleavage/methylation domain-containing protein [Deltaproteobacteria bacterium]|nr:prepilin-type N-terminal cleavage/methylation domain-containing protein [Deltaproteobacteria bacterium]
MLNSRGFSLIEVLLGISVFMIGMLGVTALNISSLKSNTFSGNLSEATLIAAAKIEDMMTMDFDDIVDTDLDGTDQDAPGDPDNDDGIDDDDDADGTNNKDGKSNFGLDDIGCPLSTPTIAEADGCDTGLGKNEIFTLYWNVAVSEPLTVDPPRTKTINVIVQWFIKEEPRQINMQVVRMKEE